MKKLILGLSLFCLLALFFAPVYINAQNQAAQQPIVPCEGKVTCTGTPPNQTCINDCSWTQFRDMLSRILDIITLQIATPLAVLALIVGAIIMLTSAGNPGMAGLGKKIIWAAIIGLLLALGSRAIVNFVLKAIGAGQYNV